MLTVCAIHFISLLTYDGTSATERGMSTFGALALSSFFFHELTCSKIIIVLKFKSIMKRRSQYRDCTALMARSLTNMELLQER
jgi:hypothetical protein